MNFSPYPAPHGAFTVCYKCTRPWKKPGCHDHCPDYLKEKKANDERNRIEREQRDVDRYLDRRENKREYQQRKCKYK